MIACSTLSTLERCQRPQSVVLAVRLLVLDASNASIAGTVLWNVLQTHTGLRNTCSCKSGSSRSTYAWTTPSERLRTWEVTCGWCVWFRFSVVGGFESRSGYSVFGLLVLYLLRWFCLPCVRCFALPCVRFVCSGRDELIVLDRKQWAVLEPVVVRCPRSTHCVRGKRWKLACDAQAKRGKP